MILSDHDIRTEMALRNVVIKPYKAQQMNVNSYDVELGNHFALLKWSGMKPIFYMVEVPDGQALKIPSGETVLAVTKETVGAQGNITTQIRAKSTTRRLGISICDDAGLGDVGYIERWTMELTANTFPYAVVTVGQRIAQVVFHYVCTKPDSPYNGQYNGAVWPEFMVPERYRKNIRHIKHVGESTFFRLIEELNWQEINQHNNLLVIGQRGESVLDIG